MMWVLLFRKRSLLLIDPKLSFILGLLNLEVGNRIYKRNIRTLAIDLSTFACTTTYYLLSLLLYFFFGYTFLNCFLKCRSNPYPALPSNQRLPENEPQQLRRLRKKHWPGCNWTLYIILYIRSDPPEPNDFHWGYYFHENPQGGLKYHMRNIGGGWIPDHGKTGGVFKSNFLCVLIQIASVPQAKHSQLDQIMRSRDGDVNSIPGVTCRVWLMTILQQLLLHEVVRCSSVDALIQECMAIGNQYSAAAAKKSQPRPVVRSRLCLWG